MVGSALRNPYAITVAALAVLPRAVEMERFPIRVDETGAPVYIQERGRGERRPSDPVN